MDLLIEITVSDDCNKNCSYCFEKNRKPSVDMFDRWKPYIIGACEAVAENKLPDVDGIQLTFWGGEPFLRYDRMLDLISATSGYGFVSYHVYTNGTLGKQTRAFCENPAYKAVSGRFSAQVSYDGSPCNEKRRGYGFADIRDQAAALANSGASVSFKATLCYGDIQEFPALWDSYAALADEWPGIKYSPTLDSAGCSAETPCGWRAVVAELCRREYGFYRKRGRFLMSWFDDDGPRRCRLDHRTFLHTDGTQYVCHGCPYSGDSRLKLGSLADESVKFVETPSFAAPPVCCDATYCTRCNTFGMPGGNLREAWNSCRVRDSGACRMYAEFGRYRRALIYRLIRDIGNPPRSSVRGT